MKLLTYLERKIIKFANLVQGDPKKIGISVFFNVFCNFFWVTVNYTIKIENCLCIADFLKAIEHNRKIRNSNFFLEKKFVKQKMCNSYIYMQALTIFYRLLMKEFWDMARKSANKFRAFSAF